MKNNKSMPLIVTLLVLVIALAGACVFLLTKKDTKIEGYDGEGYKVLSIEESSKKVPDFEIRIRGAYEGVINDEFIKEDGIKMYDFEATIDTGWQVVKENYTGIKLKDLLEYYQLENFSTVDFVSNDRITVQYVVTEVTDNCFLVFYKDGKLITNTGKPMLLAVDYDIRYSLREVNDMNFVVYDSMRVDTDKE